MAGGLDGPPARGIAVTGFKKETQQNRLAA